MNTLLLAQAAGELDSFEKLAGSVIAVAVTILLAAHRHFRAAKAQADIEKLHRAVAVAYGATTNVAKFTSTKVDDKAAYALGVLKAQLEAQGLQLTPAVATQARAEWDAMHAQEKLGAVPLEQLRQLIQSELAQAKK